MVRRIGFGDGDKRPQGAVRRSRQNAGDAAETPPKRERDGRSAAEHAQAKAERRAEARAAGRGEVGFGGADKDLRGRFFRTLFRIGVVAVAAIYIFMAFGGVNAALAIIQAVIEGYLPIATLMRPLFLPIAAVIIAFMISAPRTPPRNRAATSAPSRSAPEARERARKAYRKRQMRNAEAADPALSEGVEVAQGCGRVFVGLFLTVWLIGWTAGIVFAALALFDGAGGDNFATVFLVFWITFALFGWVVAVRKLLSIIGGGDVENVRR